MSNENNERNIPEDTAENIRSGGTALSLGSTALKMLDKCGAICKKIPVATIGFYIYSAPSMRWILPSDAGIGGIERYDTEYCGKSDFN